MPVSRMPDTLAIPVSRMVRLIRPVTVVTSLGFQVASTPAAKPSVSPKRGSSYSWWK